MNLVHRNRVGFYGCLQIQRLRLSSRWRDDFGNFLYRFSQL